MENLKKEEEEKEKDRNENRKNIKWARSKWMSQRITKLIKAKTMSHIWFIAITIYLAMARIAILKRQTTVENKIYQSSHVKL